ncbi:hypothetical protein SASPL_125655 [Salvia splendens]|uniref:Phosphatidylinositol glycan, class W n=1 Tax=Salvia splendens TaxID=180675 RepID=A0A8X8XFV5_SALSN|nr:hypothetical protein SASPL_125655 [Salvia splendens]
MQCSRFYCLRRELIIVFVLFRFWFLLDVASDSTGSVMFNFFGHFWGNLGHPKKDDNVAGGGKSFNAYVAVLLIDYLCIAMPYILYLTVSFGTVLMLLLLFCLKTFDRNRPSFLQEGGVDSIREDITSYRVSMMLVTCFSILAVDFKIFPRRYAKTETYGTGLVRIIVNYQVHVGAYGVHWNFFFTLAAVAILTLIVNVHPKYCGILGLLILIGYWGMYLIGVRIGSYAFFGDNADAILKTKTWTRTRVWVLCMFFWSLTLLLDWYVEATSRRMCNMAYVSLILAINLQGLGIVMMFDCVPRCKSSAMEEAFSRNMLASFLLVREIVAPTLAHGLHTYDDSGLDRATDHQFSECVQANVLTGLVNLSIDTLSASSISALAILFAYAFILCFVVGIANFFGMGFKFW